MSYVGQYPQSVSNSPYKDLLQNWNILLMAKSLANWYFGNFCTKCALIDSKETNYGKDHWEKLHELEKKLGTVTHKEFRKIVKMSTFCKPIPRKFEKCKLCELSGWK